MIESELVRPSLLYKTSPAASKAAWMLGILSCSSQTLRPIVARTSMATPSVSAMVELTSTVTVIHLDTVLGDIRCVHADRNHGCCSRRAQQRCLHQGGQPQPAGVVYETYLVA